MPEQRDAPTLCAGWTPHHMAAHLVTFVDVPLPKFMFNVSKANTPTAPTRLSPLASLVRWAAVCECVEPRRHRPCDSLGVEQPDLGHCAGRFDQRGLPVELIAA